MRSASYSSARRRLTALASAIALAAVVTACGSTQHTDLTSSFKHARVMVDLYSRHAFSMSVMSDGATMTVIVSGGRAYERADRKFLLKTSGGESSVAALLADRWFVVPGTSARQLAALAARGYRARRDAPGTPTITRIGRTGKLHVPAHPISLRTLESDGVMPSQQTSGFAALS